MAYGRGSYTEILELILDPLTSSIAAMPIIMLYIAPTMAVHSRTRMAAFDGRQRCFDGGHEMQALFCG
jgi:hypothetical protein